MTTTTLPLPLVSPVKHPLKWVWNKVQLLGAAVVLAYLGLLIVVALYYLLFEVNPTMTRLWHQTITNSNIRHDVRNVGEGLLGGLLAQQIIWNHYKKKLNKPKNWLDKLEIALHIPNTKDGKPLSVWQLVLSPFFVILYAAPGFAVALGISHFIHRHSGQIVQLNTLHPKVHLTAHTASLWAKTKASWTQNWDKKLMGYGASLFFGRRPAKGVFDDMQLLFVERRLANHQPLRWYHPPTFKARYNDMLTAGVTPVRHSELLKVLVVGSIPVGLGLAVFGWYVLSYIAK